MISIIEDEALKSEDIKNLLGCFKDVFKLETVTVYLKITEENKYKKYLDCPKSFINSVYMSTKGKRDPIHYITTDLLTLYWSGWLEDLEYISDKNPSHHEPRIRIRSSSSLVETPYLTKTKEGDYIGFLSDWIENDNPDVLEQLRKYGYIM